MAMERIPRHLRAGRLFGSLVTVLMFVAPAGAEAPGNGPEGQVEVIYRSVSIDGSEDKFNEDFDGLDSGARLGHVELNWNQTENGFFDFARVSMDGLGGEPFEYSALEMGRKDAYDLKLVYQKQSYVYDLLSVTDDLDGHSWDTESRRTRLDLSLYPSERVEVMLGYHEGRRTGDSFFLKDIQRDIYRLETPVDREVRNYSVGVGIDAGPVDLLFRQTLRRFDHQFDNSTRSDSGYDTTNLDFVDHYQWEQNQDGSADFTNVDVLASLGRRVSLAVSYLGTPFGEEEIDDRVRLNADGLDFNGDPFTIDDAKSEMTIRRETDLFDVDLAIDIVAALTLHLQYRSLDRETKADGVDALEGFPDDVETRLDYSLDMATALVEYRPLDSLALRAGYRTTDRELDRDGFPQAPSSGNEYRNEDYESDGDETILLGFSWRPNRKLHFTGDYQDGDRDRAFTNVSLYETEEWRLRAMVRPTESTRLSVTYRDFENRNRDDNFRDAAAGFDSSAEGESWAISFSQSINQRADYLLTYTHQDMDTAAAVVYDLDDELFFFQNNFEPGDSRFDVDNWSFLGQVNLRFTDAWRGFARAWVVESEGNDRFVGDTTGVISEGVIDQDYSDFEVGLTRHFVSGLFAGGAVRWFDYGDEDEIRDYDGAIVTVRAGFTF